MSFQTESYLRKATARAKSDVANKLVSMFLHEISRRICIALALNVSDSHYIRSVVEQFGINCCYCDRLLENDRVAIEHLDGMNRFRAGLHIPGNVILSCKKCNNEKRRDDQRPMLILAKSGWESFLSHDSTKCAEGCKSCAYWKSVWQNGDDQQIKKLEEARSRIASFRSQYRDVLIWSAEAEPLLHQELDKIYRECQDFATTRIKGAVENVISGLPLQHSQLSHVPKSVVCGKTGSETIVDEG